jgi:hypothetical protein
MKKMMAPRHSVNLAFYRFTEIISDEKKEAMGADINVKFR